jgi:hypothetical protein
LRRFGLPSRRPPVPETIQITATCPEPVVRALHGRHPDARHFDLVLDAARGDADVYKPDGSLLLSFRAAALRDHAAACRLAYPSLLKAATPTEHRPVAAAGATRFRSQPIGFLNGRATAFTLDDRTGWRCVQPLIRELDGVFRTERPGEYAVNRAAAERAPAELVIPGTAFTTVTVNRNASTGVHRDAGNLPGGYGVLSVIEAGHYAGGLLVFPRFRVAVELRSCDVLIADNREAHGNTPIIGAEGTYERIAVICYFHAGRSAAAVLGGKG